MDKHELTDGAFPLFEASADPMILLDKKGKILRVNKSALKIIGHKRDFLVGKGFMNVKLLTKQSKVRAVKNFAKRMLGHKIEPYEVQMYHKDGHLLDVEINAAPILDNTRIIADLVSIRDISSRKEQEREIGRGKAMLDAIYQNVPVGLTLVDEDGQVVETNQSLKKILSSKEDPRGLNLFKLPNIQKNEAIKGVLEDLLKNEQPFALYDQEYYSFTGDKKIYATFIGEPLGEIYEDKKKYSLIMVDDTTELHQAHAMQLKKEKEVQKLKDQFVFVAAHELKTPVTAIKWGVEMLTESGKEVPEALKQNMEEVLDNINSNNNRLSKLVSDLLDVARMDYGTFAVEAEKMDLVKVVNQSVKSIGGVAKNEGISISVDAPDKQMVFADPVRVEGVLINLLSNGIKYNTPKGSIAISVKKKKGFAEVLVTDTGIGFSKIDARDLFSRFYRVERKEVFEKEGTGLGLYITRNMIDKMGGDISVESDGRGKGSTFTFTLPLKK